MLTKLSVWVVVTALAVCANGVLAAEAGIVGSWAANSRGRRVSMEFTGEGQCHIKSTEKGKTTKVDGIYELKGDRLVVTSNDRKPIVYTVSLKGDSLTLSGGYLAVAQPMTLTRGSEKPAGPAEKPGQPEKPAQPEKPSPQKPQDGPKVDKPAGENAGLPGGTWDLKDLEQAFAVIKTQYDAGANKVTWLLEKKVEGFVSFNISFYDEDDVKLGMDYLQFEPSTASVAKGERTRGSGAMLKPEEMKKVKKVVITKR